MSALRPFQKICTPMQTNKNDDNRRITGSEQEFVETQ
jgi:hypothetical protein